MDTFQKRFLPVSPIFFVTESSFIKLEANQITASTVGLKAYGLSCVPPVWTLPFIVISSDLFERWKIADVTLKLDILKKWLKAIADACYHANIPSSAKIIIRSSGIHEGICERGEYYSVHGEYHKLHPNLERCLNLLENDKTISGKKICLIIQSYIPLLSEIGHLSNERRCNKEARDWYIEYSNEKLSDKINIRHWRKKIKIYNATEAPLQCNRFDNLQTILQYPSTWAYEKNVRIHYEWIWDGQCVYIVQADVEQKVSGVNPTKIIGNIPHNFSNFSFNCLHPLSDSHAQKYSKINNVYIYKQLNLPTTNFYILQDKSLIAEIANGNIPTGLKKDLEMLVKESLVIRMDVDSKDQTIQQMLPRTNEVRDIDSALEWLTEQCKKEELTAHNPIFIFHNFLPSSSSAFVYASPGQRKVIINALWGLPEGLYYNSFDTYIVDTGHRDISKLHNISNFNFKIEESPKYKHHFYAPDQNGVWRTHVLAQPYDWKLTITDHSTINTIAYQSRLIAEKVNKPISIMWFIGVHNSISPTGVMPWYHEFYDIEYTRVGSQLRRKTIFDKDFIIRNNSDLLRLQQEPEGQDSMIRCIRIQPNDDKLLRDKSTLKNIGILASKLNATIILEGSTLSHAYYQLLQTNAHVEAVPFPISQTRFEYYKLVRDHIPDKILSGGELVQKTKFSGNDLLRLLKDKLVEESFEVLDTTGRDELLEELSDLNELIDSILKNIQSDRRELAIRQKIKADKAGRFDEGFVLLETDNPLPLDKVSSIKKHSLPVELSSHSSKRPDYYTVFEKSRAISKWADHRIVPPESESILSLDIPLLNDNWSATSPEYHSSGKQKYSIRLKITGKRVGSRINLRISMLHVPTQIKFPPFR